MPPRIKEAWWAEEIERTRKRGNQSARPLRGQWVARNSANVGTSPTSSDSAVTGNSNGGKKRRDRAGS